MFDSIIHTLLEYSNQINHYQSYFTRATKLNGLLRQQQTVRRRSHFQRHDCASCETKEECEKLAAGECETEAEVEGRLRAVGRRRRLAPVSDGGRLEHRRRTAQGLGVRAGLLRAQEEGPPGSREVLHHPQ